jgi:hypothetical protein
MFMKVSRIALVALSMQGIGLMAVETPVQKTESTTHDVQNQREEQKKNGFLNMAQFYLAQTSQVASGLLLKQTLGLTYLPKKCLFGGLGVALAMPQCIATWQENKDKSTKEKVYAFSKQLATITAGVALGYATEKQPLQALQEDGATLKSLFASSAAASK